MNNFNSYSDDLTQMVQFAVQNSKNNYMSLRLNYYVSLRYSPVSSSSFNFTFAFKDHFDILSLMLT